MFSVYLTTSSGDWLGLVLVMGAIALLGAFGRPGSRKLMLALLVLAGLAMTRAVLLANPYSMPCDPVWRWMGWCR